MAIVTVGSKCFYSPRCGLQTLRQVNLCNVVAAYAWLFCTDQRRQCTTAHQTAALRKQV